MANLFNEIKHALFLENGYWRDQIMVKPLHEHLVSLGIKCTIIDNAVNRKDEIIKALPTVDTVIFESTFLYANEVRGVGNLLKMVKTPLMVFGGVIGGNNETLQGRIERIWDVKELAEMSHHRLFQLMFSRYSIEQEAKDLYFEVDMLQYKADWEAQEHERITKNKNMPKTGRKVLIKKLQYFDAQSVNLKEGDVVDELDCRSIDKKPNRGIWVMGVDEPLKLLNSDGYDEWEYHEPTYLALTKEFFARGNKSNASQTDEYRELFNLMAEWIRKCSSELQTSDVELWEWCDNICNSVGVERRGNRNYFDRRLKEYRSRYVCFREPA
jgi:hypothetical protein